MAEPALPATMPAWVFHRHGDPAEVLRLRHVPVPRPGTGQLLVRVEAAAVNFADDLIVRGTYQSRPPLPAVPGMEFAGRVALAGSDTSTPAGTLMAGLGHQLVGGFGGYALVDEPDAFGVPDDFAVEEAAAFTVAYQTAWFALHVRGRLAPGDTVLVYAAAGGVGLAAVQIAKAAGAIVLGVVGSPGKAAVARDAGADMALLRTDADLVARIKHETGGRGVDIVVDPVGGGLHGVSERAVGFDGRIVLLGFSSGDLPAVRPDLILVKNYSVIGLHWGLYRSMRPDVVATEYRRLRQAVSANGIRPVISRVHAFDEAPLAMARVRNGRSTGRVVVRGPALRG